ncbi:hypothetical protein [Desulfoluna spongiiphila]|uniref:Uncharacterized protein n=1 Tax=Desulfoluna spongiiphila TaxID=419481 RepID=A0A1G5B178_9BACT|nr:hypothetical protein [Desulfoluna spongiiphila]SCX83907.1 hypothetical protein SAMN05216233_101568 [Desulfoluna spongiiphila]VVS92127.1 hypothetical protein DBB_16950 [Desulfoluna spongiiphila]
MQAKIHDVQKQAKKVLKSDWTKIAPTYTFGWGGPLSWAEEMFPHISTVIDDVRETVSDDLPIVVYQTRENPPNSTVAAIPFKTEDGNPYNIRIVPSETISEKQITLLSHFAQAFLFLTASGGLPEPWEPKALSKALVKLTGKKLIG